MWFVTIHPVGREYAKSVVVEEQFGGFRRIVAVADLQCHGRVHWKIGGRKFQRRLQFGFVSMLQMLESARVDGECDGKVLRIGSGSNPSAWSRTWSQREVVLIDKVQIIRL